MADVTQWRRKVPGGRARAPAAPAHDDLDIEPPVSGGATTPKKSVKSKLSSHFAGNSAQGTAASLLAENHEEATVPFMPDLPSWPIGDPYPDPDPDTLVESVMIQLMQYPLTGLDAKYNNVLMRIFECYRQLKDELAEARAQLNKERNRSYGIASQGNAAEERWDEERGLYKEEVRRLEIVISKSNRGLAGVTMARQESVLRRRQKERAEDDAENARKETVLEFLEGTRIFDDRGYSSQRATMRTVPRSPSQVMKALSRKFTKKTSATHVHPDLPFGTPPRMPQSTLAEASLLEDEAQHSRFNRLRSTSDAVSEPNTGASDASFSSFSATGDLLPDEEYGIKDDASPEQDPDIIAIKRIATTLSKRRGVSTEVVLPKLFELFREQGEDKRLQTSTHTPHRRLARIPPPTIESTQVSPTPTRRKSSAQTLSSGASLMSKASGFFHRLRPPPHIDTSSPFGPALSRRFSFEFGDDTTAIDAALVSESGNANLGRTLRKSASLPSLGERAQRVPIPSPMLSPVLSSPTDISPSSASRRASRIPSPAYVSFLARPRQDRDDSMSSLMTAIKHSDDDTRRNNSMSSSRYSSVVASPTTMHSHRGSGGSYGEGPSKRTSSNSHSSNRLLEHNNNLRSSPAAIAAARAASNTVVRNSGSSEGSSSVQTSHANKSSVQSGAMVRSPEATSPSGHARRSRTKENTRPLAAKSGHTDEEGAH